MSRTASLTDYAGQTVTLYFLQNDGGLGSGEGRYVDNIAVQTDRPPLYVPDAPKLLTVTAANQINARKLSVREAESLVKKVSAEFSGETALKPKPAKSRDLKRVEEELSDLLMAEVEVRVKKRVKRAGKLEEMGELVIQFGSLDALNGLIDKLRG